MRLVLLPRATTSRAEVDALLASAKGGPTFDTVVPCYADDEADGAPPSPPDRWISLLPQVEMLADVAAAPHRILLLTTSDAHVRAARGAGVRTCRLQPPKRAAARRRGRLHRRDRGRVPPIIEDENGIPYRSAQPVPPEQHARRARHRMTSAPRPATAAREARPIKSCVEAVRMAPGEAPPNPLPARPPSARGRAPARAVRPAADQT